MELRVRVRREEGSYWAEVEELPGCFASGLTLDELVEALTEAIVMYGDEQFEGVMKIQNTSETPTLRVEELRVEIPGSPPVPA